MGVQQQGELIGNPHVMTKHAFAMRICVSKTGLISEEEIDMAHKNIKEEALKEETKVRWLIHLPRPVCVVFLCVALAFGCKKTEPAAPVAQPVAVPVAPAAPVVPVPTFSAAQKIGMFVYPKNNQSHDQQLIDESACYDTVGQQTGINPEAGGPQAPSSADVAAAEQQGAANAAQSSGGRVRGAGRGALGGAAIGAISGNAGRGAAIGAGVGTVRGGRKQRQANEASQSAGAQSAASQQHQAYAQSKAAYNKQIDTFKRGFSACMDARGYSVK
jgi:Glycine-zipper domain